MKRLGVFILCFLVGIAVSVDLRSYWFLIFPTDANMTAHFERNEKSFDQLVERFRQDKELSTLSVRSEIRGERKDSSIKKTDSLTYATLKTIKIGTLRRDSKAPVLRVSFFVSMSEMDSSAYTVDFYKERGYIYSESPLSPLVDSIDSIKDGTQRSSVVYKQIAPNWYIYQELIEIKCRS